MAGMLWFLAAMMSAMTVVANRVFVVSVPHESAGRAFGIAATGISGSQGLGTIADRPDSPATLGPRMRSPM